MNLDFLAAEYHLQSNRNIIQNLNYIMPMRKLMLPCRLCYLLPVIDAAISRG